eukprot:4861180-Prymnesium_polylepis.1
MWIPRRHLARVASAAQEEVSTRGLGNQHTFIHTLFGTRRSLDPPPARGAATAQQLSGSWPAEVYGVAEDAREVGFLFPPHIGADACAGRGAAGFAIGLVCDQLRSYRPIRG